MTTQITALGVAAAGAAVAGGLKININMFKVGSTVTPPVPSDPTTDILPPPAGDLVYTGDATKLQYGIVDSNTIEYVVTLDEPVGNFSVGRIGLYMDNGDGTHTLFSITAIDAPNPDYKFATAGNQVGDRLKYSIYLAISNFSRIANFTIPLLVQLKVPEVSNETFLTDPLHVTFNTAQVMKHTLSRVAAIAYRETASQGRPLPLLPAWLMRPERLIPGQGEGIIPIDQSFFDVGAPIGTVVGLDSINHKIIVGEPANNQSIIGIRSSVEEVTNYGIYVDPVNVYNPMQKLYAGSAAVSSGSTLGKLTTIANNWPIGYALGPCNTPNAVGYLCWIDFTLGVFGGDVIGPPGPKGAQGDPGPPGGGAAISTPGAYLKLIGTNLVLIPYNGNLIVINKAVQKIPYGGVALAPTNLSPSTLYYIYAYMNGLTMMLEASVISHATSTIDGVEIKGGDQTRSLVGMAYTIAGPAWTDVAPSTDGPGSGNALASGYNVGKLYVLSWFNKRPKSVVTSLKGNLNYSAGVTTSSTSLTELKAIDLRNYFLTWANREVQYSTSGECLVPSPRGVATVMQFDGIGYEKYGAGAHQNSLGTNLVMQPGVQGVKQGLSEGPHFGSLLGAVLNGRGSATWRLGIGGNGPVMDAPVSLEITVEG